MDDISDYSRFEVEDSQIMINSASRDTTAYPDASNYTIDFSSTPFKLVVGVSLLSASIPRSGYVVDEGRNTMAFAAGEPPYDAANVESVTVDPGDYNLPQICATLASNITTFPFTIVPLTNPAEIMNKILFYSPAPFSLVMDRESLGGKLGFGRAVNQTDIDAGYYDATPAWKERNFIDANVYVAKAVASNTAAEAFVGPRPFTQAVDVTPLNVLTQQFTVQVGGFSSALDLSVKALAAPTTFHAALRDADGKLLTSGFAVGNAGETTVVIPLNVPKKRKVNEALTMGAVATFSVTTDANCTIFTNPRLNPVDPANAIAVDGVTTSTALSVCAILHVFIAGYRVVSPGIVDLTGDRFLTVRCPEVESYLVNSERLSSQSTHPGIGLLTLGTYGFSEARLDFYNFKPRMLTTPIGRLTKMTIVLEAQDRTPYPTRGCDHTMLINVRCLVPKRAPHRAGDVGSILSPGYSSNMWEYNAGVDARARPGQFRRIVGGP